VFAIGQSSFNDAISFRSTRRNDKTGAVTITIFHFLMSEWKEKEIYARKTMKILSSDELLAAERVEKHWKAFESQHEIYSFSIAARKVCWERRNFCASARNFERFLRDSMSVSNELACDCACLHEDWRVRVMESVIESLMFTLRTIDDVIYKKLQLR
jgi:hypothetical protein